MIKVKINNLELRKASYLTEEPEHPSYHIDLWYSNPYFGKESEFIEDGDYYTYKDRNGFKIHKNCFKNPESCYAIASFDWDGSMYELCFIGDRPLSKEYNRDDFWTLIELGYKLLNKNETD